MQVELKSEGKEVSIRKLCSILGTPRSTMYYKPVVNRKPIPVDVDLQLEIYAIIQKYPEYVLRRIRVELYRNGGKWFNRKKIHRIIKRNHWQIRVKPKGHRSRAQG
jgi:hypothetical protein